MRKTRSCPDGWRSSWPRSPLAWASTKPTSVSSFTTTCPAAWKPIIKRPDGLDATARRRSACCSIPRAIAICTSFSSKARIPRARSLRRFTISSRASRESDRARSAGDQGPATVADCGRRSRRVRKVARTSRRAGTARSGGKHGRRADQGKFVDARRLASPSGQGQTPRHAAGRAVRRQSARRLGLLSAAGTRRPCRNGLAALWPERCENSPSSRHSITSPPFGAGRSTCPTARVPSKAWRSTSKPATGASRQNTSGLTPYSATARRVLAARDRFYAISAKPRRSIAGTATIAARPRSPRRDVGRESGRGSRRRADRAQWRCPHSRTLWQTVIGPNALRLEFGKSDPHGVQQTEHLWVACPLTADRGGRFDRRPGRGEIHRAGRRRSLSACAPIDG